MQHPSSIDAHIYALFAIITLSGFSCEPPDEAPRPPIENTDKNPEEQTLTNAPDYGPEWLTGAFGFISIEAPDGTLERLQIIEQDVDVALDHRIAHTTVTQLFKNHTLGHQQGTYTFALPEGAQVTGFAIDTEEKRATTLVLEDKRLLPPPTEQLPTLRSPDLTIGKEAEPFTIEVAEIPPGRTATVTLMYQQVLSPKDGKVTYTYAMPRFDRTDANIPRIPRFFFDMKVAADDAKDLEVTGYSIDPSTAADGVMGFKRKRFVPLGPIEVTRKLPGADKLTAYALRDPDEKQNFLVDLTLPVTNTEGTSAARAIGEIVLVLDTSAGGGQRALDRSVAFSKALLAELPEELKKRAKVTVLTSDLTTRACSERGSVDAIDACFKDLIAAGASDLGALADALERELAAASAPKQVIYIGDGRATHGEVRPYQLTQAFAQAVGETHRLHTVSVGLQADEDFLRALATRSGGLSVRLPSSIDPDDSLSPRRIIDAMMRPPVRIEKVEGIGAEGSRLVPSSSFGVIPGEPILLTGRVDSEKSAKLVLEGTREGQPFRQEIELGVSQRALNPAVSNIEARRWHRELARQGGTLDELAELAIKDQVLGPRTHWVTVGNRAANAETLAETITRTSHHTFSLLDIASFEVRGKDDTTTPSKDPDADPLEAPVDKPGEDEGRAEDGAPGQELDDDTEQPTPLDEEEKEPESIEALPEPDESKTPAEPGEGEGAEDAEREDGGDKTDDAFEVTLAKPLVSKTCSRAAVARQLDARAKALSTCFRGQRSAKPRPAGRITFAWEVDPIGRASEVRRLESSIENKLVLACMERVITRTRLQGHEDYCVVVQSYALDDTSEEPLSSRAPIEREVVALEKRAEELSFEEDVELLEKLVLLDEQERARAWFEILAAKHAKRSPLEVLRHPITQEYFDVAFRNAVRFVIGNMKRSNPLASRVASQLAERKARDEFIVTFATRNIDPGISAEALDIMSTTDPSIVPIVWERWGSIYTPRRRYGMLLSIDGERTRWPKMHLEALLDLRGTSDMTRARREDALELGIELGELAKVADFFVESCSTKQLSVSWCLTRVKAFAKVLDPKQNEQLVADLRANQLQDIELMRDRRSGDMGNPKWIIEHARLHEELGEEQLARRILSELIEFSPDASRSHQVYAQQLERRGEVERACAEYGLAFTLDPRRRAVLSDWTRFYARHAGKGGVTSELQNCVVRTVADLRVDVEQVVVGFGEVASGPFGLVLDAMLSESKERVPEVNDKAPSKGGRLVRAEDELTRGFVFYFVGEVTKGTYDVLASGAGQRGEVALIDQGKREGGSEPSVSWVRNLSLDKEPSSVATFEVP